MKTMNYKSMQLTCTLAISSLFAVLGLIFLLPPARTIAHAAPFDPSDVPPGIVKDAGSLPYKTYLPLVYGAALPQARNGWIIGTNYPAGLAVILHTAGSGVTWQSQGDLTPWPNYEGMDISAVDNLTAWAVLSSETSGVILHTTDGGTTWLSQTIPSSVTDGMKGIKGLSQDIAWAASLNGTVLHTTNGGADWSVVPHPSAPITQVNRIDALGGLDVWIADSSTPGGSVVHTQDNGLTWRQEFLPPIETGPTPDSSLVVNAFSPSAVWSSGVSGSIFYRTVNSGNQWDKIVNVAPIDHLDDLCAAGANDVWAVENGDSLSGTIWRLDTAADGAPVAKNVTPPGLVGYMPSGVTCLDTNVAWVVGSKGVMRAPSKPFGIILFTLDGGEHWRIVLSPVNSNLWKISFVGARR